MSFLPPVRIFANIIRESHNGYGGIAMNVDGTLFASVDSEQHCVYIYNVIDLSADPVVVGTPGIRGSAHGQLDSPLSACFVYRNSKDSLLICDRGNDRVVEVTDKGVFLREIAFKDGVNGILHCGVTGISYCTTSDVIAVSLCYAHAVVLLQYESGAVKPEVTIGSRTGTPGGSTADGQLYYPHGVTITKDGHYIFVADWVNRRVSKFSAVNGAFIAHVATKAANGILNPSDVLQCEDGSILVTQWQATVTGNGNTCVVKIGADGVTLDKIIISSPCGVALIPHSLSHFPSFHGVLVKCFDGSVFCLRDAWSHSPRCAWVHACVS